jgi:hypothetical protein
MKYQNTKDKTKLKLEQLKRMPIGLFTNPEALIIHQEKLIKAYNEKNQAKH